MLCAAAVALHADTVAFVDAVVALSAAADAWRAASSFEEDAEEAEREVWLPAGADISLEAAALSSEVFALVSEDFAASADFSAAVACFVAFIDRALATGADNEALSADFSAGVSGERA
ncbi:hypothetical protein QM042_01820 [Escherichia coli]